VRLPLLALGGVVAGSKLIPGAAAHLARPSTSRQITFVPGFFKIFDEILVNAADNKVRCSSLCAVDALS
jgi:hypothetical protein